MIEKNLEGVYPDDIFSEQLELIDKKLAEAYLQQKQAALKDYSLEALLQFAQEKLSDIKRTYENSNTSQRKALLSSLFPLRARWLFPGISNTEISPLHQPIQHPEILNVQFGDA